MFEFINVLKFIGAVLITNSHFDNLYPVAAMSIGGSLGNVCFFLAAGFCLSNSISEGKGGVLGWMYSRAKRVYPALWIAITFYAVIGRITLNSDNVFFYYFFPYFQFWFISAILIFYLLMYYVVKYLDQKLWIVGLGIVATYFFFYFTYVDLTKWSVEGPDFFKYIFYFGVMYLGYVLKKSKKVISQLNKEKISKISGILILVSLALYLVSKVALIKFPILNVVQFLVHIFTLMFGLSCFFFLYAIENTLKSWSQKKLYGIVTYISSATLEIYLVNYVCAYFCERLFFPMNVVAAFIFIAISGIALHWIVNKIQKHLLK